MLAPNNRFQDKVLAFIYFVGFEVGVYFLLSFFLFDPVEKNPNPSETTIVRDWNTFTFFLLLYVTITVTTMLLLTTMLPRPYKPQVMRYFWWSWIGLMVMVGIAFN